MGVWVFAAVLSGCSDDHGADGNTVTVFVAASTAPAMEPLLNQYARIQGVHVVVNAASSATLAQQIRYGQTAHLYLSAHPGWAQEALGGAKGPVKPLLSNRLVLVAPAADPRGFLPSLGAGLLAEDGKIAMADPASVPAGIYGKQALQAAGVWARIEHRVVPCKDVRAALRLVERGEATLGLVYTTDAASSSAVQVVYRFDEAMHEPIRYPLVLLHETQAAGALYQWLGGAAARRAFTDAGFIWLPDKDGLLDGLQDGLQDGLSPQRPPQRPP